MGESVVDRRAEASDSVAERFDRTMNAAISPRGWLTDLSLAFAVAAIPLVLFLRQVAFDDPKSPVTAVLAVLALAPIVGAIVLSVSLRSARGEVVDFLASLPFPIENMNALLAGVSDELVIVVPDGAGKLPDRAELQPKLDAIHDDALLTATDDERRELAIKIGVPQNKHFPLRAAHERYARFVRIIREVVVPMASTLGVARVRIG